MKLSARITLVTVIIVIVAVCLSGTVMLLAAFRSEAEGTMETAQEELEVLCRSLGTLACQSQGAPETALVKILGESGLFEGSGLAVFHNRTEVLWCPEGQTPVLYLPENNENWSCRYLETDPQMIEAVRKLVLGEEIFYVRLTVRMQEPFLHTQENLRTYTWALLLSVLVSFLAAVTCTGILLRPIRLLSRSTRAIAQGQYGRRIRVQSGDELGALAADFNTMAQALESRIRQLTVAAQRQKEFTAAFAHELKTPLTSVIGYADMLRSKSLPEPHALEAADYIFTEGQRLAAMSRTLLELFRLEEQELVLVPIRAEQLVNKLSKSVLPMLQQRQLRFRMQTEPGEFLGVSELLLCLLYNLIDNGAKASPPGATLMLLGREEEKGYAFEVVDRGCGIPPESIQRITEAFYMVDRSRARAQGGAGLGLALCSRIAALHHGQLEFQSRPGYGTRVILSLRKGVESQ